MEKVYHMAGLAGPWTSYYEVSFFRGILTYGKVYQMAARAGPRTSYYDVNFFE